MIVANARVPDPLLSCEVSSVGETAINLAQPSKIRGGAGRVDPRAAAGGRSRGFPSLSCSARDHPRRVPASGFAAFRASAPWRVGASASRRPAPGRLLEG